ncbi:MAG: hypothetical protein A2527_12835 [Candidatus Lambdaproteobacteria bacterium RIFOXYD2_FULL_50_16]|uniref:Uncharacterized protein n=1 Tax=Candidatus Lambdaproteobacteria bacterium RIFOXYD2_FULL_50_16 TaxID=1817772 RepID=A0A1F6G9P8_9PROT|nr:MAG: hypothetical protein A2527_12835 [Candidatus Lambdaproteobacteria bacterium RIFOXYD2_FULL_50_16]
MDFGLNATTAHLFHPGLATFMASELGCGIGHHHYDYQFLSGDLMVFPDDSWLGRHVLDLSGTAQGAVLGQVTGSDTYPGPGTPRYAFLLNGLTYVSEAKVPITLTLTLDRPTKFTKYRIYSETPAEMPVKWTLEARTGTAPWKTVDEKSHWDWKPNERLFFSIDHPLEADQYRFRFDELGWSGRLRLSRTKFFY